MPPRKNKNKKANDAKNKKDAAKAVAAQAAEDEAARKAGLATQGVGDDNQILNEILDCDDNASPDAQGHSEADEPAPEAQEHLVDPILEVEGATDNEVSLDRHLALHLQNIYSMIAETRADLFQIASQRSSDLLEELFQNPVALEDFFERLMDHFDSNDRMKDMIRSGAKKIIQSTKTKVDELDFKMSTLNKKVNSTGKVAARPNIKIDAPTFTTATASTSEGIDKFFQDLSLHFEINDVVEDKHKCGFFVSTLSKATDSNTVSMLTSIRTAVQHSAVGVPADGSPFGYIQYIDLIKVVKQTFSKTDTESEKARDFLDFTVNSRDTFTEAVRDFFTAIKGSFPASCFAEKQTVNLFRTKLLSVFEGPFPKTTEQFRTRLALLDSEESASWDVTSLERIFRDSNSGTNEKAARRLEKPRVLADRARFDTRSEAGRSLTDRSSGDRSRFDARNQSDREAKKRRTSLQGEPPVCFSCGEVGHFANDCKAKNHNVVPSTTRFGKMPKQLDGAFSKFSNINNTATRELFESEKSCAYHVTNSHSAADCAQIKLHRRHGHEWCNSCASMSHDTADCPGQPHPQGGGWARRSSAGGRAWGKASRD